MPLYERVMSDQLTPVLAYRCLVREDDRDAPSFLFESVVNGDQQGRYSFVGAQPSLEVVATKGQVVVLDHEAGTRTETQVSMIGWLCVCGGGVDVGGCTWVVVLLLFSCMYSLCIHTMCVYISCTSTFPPAHYTKIKNKNNNHGPTHRRQTPSKSL